MRPSENCSCSAARLRRDLDEVMSVMMEPGSYQSEKRIAEWVGNCAMNPSFDMIVKDMVDGHTCHLFPRPSRCEAVMRVLDRIYVHFGTNLPELNGLRAEIRSHAWSADVTKLNKFEHHFDRQLRQVDAGEQVRFQGYFGRPVPAGRHDWRREFEDEVGSFYRQHHFANYSKAEDTESEAKCTICLDIIDVAGRLPCGHNFHVECATEWYEKQSGRKTCPLCRARVDGVRVTIVKFIKQLRKVMGWRRSIKS